MISDKQILALLFSRAEEAIEALSAAYGRQLHRIAMNILGDLRDAEECVDDTYLAVWNAIPPKQPDPLAGFVLKTGRYISLARLRRDTARRRDTGSDLSLDELAGCIGGGDPAEAWEARELGRAIDRFLDTVPPESRVLFLRRYWFGDSVRDAGKFVSLTENAAAVRLNRLREKLRTYLIKEGFFHA